MSHSPDEPFQTGVSVAMHCYFCRYICDFGSGQMPRRLCGVFKLMMMECASRRCPRGQREKVSAGSGTLSQGKIIVLDELIGGVDPNAREVILGYNSGKLFSGADDSLFCNAI